MIKNAVNILAGVTQTPKLFAPGFLFTSTGSVQVLTKRGVKAIIL